MSSRLPASANPMVVAQVLARRLPSRAASRWFRAVARVSAPPVAAADAFFQRLSSQTGIAVRAHRQDAAWSWAMAAHVLRRLRAGDHDEMLAMIDRASLEEGLATLSALRGNASRGLVVVCAHLGVPHLTRVLLGRELGNVKAIIGNERGRYSPSDVVVGGDAQRNRAVLDLATHAGEGGVVVGAAEGRQGDGAVLVDVLERSVAVKRGLPTLARAAGVPTVAAGCSWAPDGRLRFQVAPTVLADAFDRSTHDRRAWEAAWLDAWARWFETSVLMNPRDVCLHGGVWHSAPGGLLA